MIKNDDPDFIDFMMEGGDDLLNRHDCPHCGKSFHLDEIANWVDKSKGLGKCPSCNEEVECG